MASLVSEDKQDQLDEVELLQAMSKEGEFDWDEDITTGTISGSMYVYPQLDKAKTVRVGRIKGRHSTPAKCEPDGDSDLDHDQCIPTTSAAVAHSPSKQVKKQLSERTADILHLPPFCLYFQHPPLYPSEERPNYTLSCKWLNFTQLTLLCQQLDQLWVENLGGVVLYMWQQFLANDVLSFLGLEPSHSTEICLEFEDPSSLKAHWDPRAIQDIGHPKLVLPYLIEFDKRGREQLFADSFFDCEICFLTYPGSKCIKMTPCNHVHCRECLAAHTATKIKDGQVMKIECPSEKCTSVLDPTIVKDLVSTELFEKFDTLLLQRTLDTMQDIVYCPRPTCRCVTVREQDSNMAQCPRCVFCFCVICQRSWHGISPCKLLSGNIKELRESWDKLDPEERSTLRAQYGKKTLERAFQEYDSYNWLGTNAKRCPRCNSNIQKTEGCNKMTCTQCRAHFCWLCDAILPQHNPYSHFRIVAGNYQSSCAGKLFEGLNGFDEDDIWW